MDQDKWVRPNALINNFNPLNFRNDVGALWENFIIAERIKFLKNNLVFRDYFFWRNNYKQEIDYLEIDSDSIYAYEIKFNTTKSKIPQIFQAEYTPKSFNTINNENFLDFLTKQ